MENITGSTGEKSFEPNPETGGSEGGAPSRGRLPYQHKLAHYVPSMKRSERTLKWLIAQGRKKSPPDLPPFDDLRRMKDWWVRVMKQRVPDDICALAAAPESAPLPPPADAGVGPLFAAAAANPTPPAPPSLPPPPLSPTPGGRGYSAALRRAREAEAASGELYNRLLAAANAHDCKPDDRTRFAAEAEQARRAWEKNAEQLRSYEKDASAILSSSGRAWLADDVIAANDIVHLVLRESLKNLMRRMRPKLARCVTDAEQDAAWDAELDGVLAVLRDNKFTAPSVASAAAPADAAAA